MSRSIVFGCLQSPIQIWWGKIQIYPLPKNCQVFLLLVVVPPSPPHPSVDACGTWHQRWCSHSNCACCANVALAMLSVKNASCCPIQPNKRHQIKSESVQVMGAQKWYLAYLEYLQKMIQKNVYMKIACTFIFIPQKIGKFVFPVRVPSAEKSLVSFRFVSFLVTKPV